MFAGCKEAPHVHDWTRWNQVAGSDMYFVYEGEKNPKHTQIWKERRCKTCTLKQEGMDL